MPSFHDVAVEQAAMALTPYKASLDPSAPGFEPSLIERGSGDSGILSACQIHQIHQQIVPSDSLHSPNNLRTFHLAQNNREEISTLKQTLTSDMQFFQNEINALKATTMPMRHELTHKERLAAAMRNPTLRQIASGQLCTNDYITLGEAYEAQAQAAEALAIELRRMAASEKINIYEEVAHVPNTQADRDTHIEDKISSKEIAASEACSTREEGASSESKSCCGIKFDAISDLLQHCHQIHDPFVEQMTSKCAPSTYQVAKETTSMNKSNFWLPFAVQRLSALDSAMLNIPSPENTVLFTYEFLTSTFNGVEYSPGFFWVPTSCKSLLPGRAYWILDKEFEPFLPGRAGAHGAKLTAFFRESEIGETDYPDVDNYQQIPLFISKSLNCAATNTEFEYYGTYSQNRFSDKLDYDRMLEIVPLKVKQYWSEQLASPGRPQWVTNAMMEHFWPKPKYDGLLPASGKHDRQVKKAMERYLADLEDWEKQARLKVNLIKAKDIMSAFEEADASEEPGLRLWWEYLECVGYDHDFYNMLVNLRDGRPAAQTGASTPPKPSSLFSRKFSGPVAAAVNGVGSGRGQVSRGGIARGGDNPLRYTTRGSAKTVAGGRVTM